MKIRAHKGIGGLLVAVALVLGLLAGPAAALSVSDMPSSLGSLQATYGPVTVINSDPAKPAEDHGRLTTSAYLEASGNYLYVAEFRPLVTGITNFGTAFGFNGIAGFTGRAGWSFADAGAAGGTLIDNGSILPGSGSFMLLQGGGNLVWFVMEDVSTFWSHYTPMHFFFESANGPGPAPYTLDWYTMTNQFAGQGSGLAPVPEPATLLLLSSGVLAAGAWTRWSRRRA